MKKTKITFLFFLIINSIFAQNAPPNGMIYQAVARDGSGNLATKRTIYVQTTVLKGTATGTVMYSDEHKVLSNADAMFTIIVGQGKYLSGSYTKLTDIPWDKDKYFFNLKICVAPSLPKWGWTPSYTDMGTTQFWSVPYAMFSGKSGDSLTLTVNGTGRQIKLGNYKPIFFSVADKDSLATNEIQTLSRTGGRLILNLNGGLVTLPDSSAINELQNITLTGGRIILNQNGGTIFLPDSSSTNELQKITMKGGRVFLDQNGGIISLPDSSSTNELQTLSQSGNVITLSNGGGSATFTDNDKQQIAINSTKGTVSLSNGGAIQLPDSSATNEIQTLSISAGKGRIALSNGGSVLLNDSSATNEIQKITRSGGRVFLDQNGGIISLPDSSSTNELQTLSQSGNVITLSNGGGSATFTDNDKQQIAINSTKGTISLSNGGAIQLPDSSATNEIQSLSISAGKGKIALSNGGSVVLNDSSATNELQKITRNGGRVILDQNGGTISLPDSSSTNELQTLSQAGNVVTLSNGGGSATFTDNDKQQISINSTKGTISLSNGGAIQLADSSVTNEIQSLTISAGKGRIALSNGGSVLLNDSSASNELQKITRDGGRVILDQNGGTIALPDSSSTNELQSLRLSNDTLYISEKNFVILSSLLSGRTETTYSDTIEMRTGVASGSVSTSSALTKVIRFDSINIESLGREIKIDFGISTLSSGSTANFTFKILGPDGKEVDKIMYTLDAAISHSSSSVNGFSRNYSISNALNVDLSSSNPGGLNRGNFISSSFVPKKSGKYVLLIAFELKGSSSSNAFINYSSITPIWHYCKSKSTYIKGNSNNSSNNTLIYTIKHF